MTKYCFAVLSLSVFLSSCVVEVEPPDPDSAQKDSAPKPERLTRAAAPLPPWNTWKRVSQGGGVEITELDEVLLSAEEREVRGELAQAEREYAQALLQVPVLIGEPSPQRTAVEKAVVLRLVGVRLKQGNSQKALEEISAYTERNQLKVGSLNSDVCLLAAYAYSHQRNVDQTLAWIGNATRRDDSSLYIERIQAFAENYAASLSLSDFERAEQKWVADQFIGKVMLRERLQRANGSSAAKRNRTGQRAAEPDWFSPKTYGDTTAAAVAAALAPADAGGKPKLGVILPLSGDYAQHGSMARQGIELALADAGFAADLVIKDSRADGQTAVNEYVALVNQDRVNLVLGPLLVKTSEGVAAKAQVLGVPFITFSKKPGLAALDDAAFRLGATAENQIREILSYAANNNLRSFALLYPEVASGYEVLEAMRSYAPEFGVNLVTQVGYRADAPTSVAAAVELASRSSAQAVLIADSIEQSFEIVQKIKSSPLATATLFGTAQWDDAVVLRGMGQLVEGAVFVTPFFSRSLRPEITQFIAKFRTRFQKEPNLLAAQAYDATNLALRAVSILPRSSTDIQSRLLGVTGFSGISGLIDSDSDGEFQRKMSVVKVQGGELIEVAFAGQTLVVTPVAPVGIQ